MDPLSATASVIAMIQLTNKLLAYGIHLRREQQKGLIERTYGWFRAVLILRFLPETASRYETISRHVIQGTREAAMSFRQATTDECNMTAVAVCPALHDATCPMIHTEKNLI